VPKITTEAGAKPFVPDARSLDQLARAAQHCEGCDLHRAATQAVLGEGPASARIVMVGEQPGNREDLAGRPFVGPAGGLLDRALAEAGIERGDVYVTNAVKHFKFEARGKRRIHKKPSSVEIVACKPWLEAELSIVRPALIVCLGATAAHSVIGPRHHLLKERGRFFPHPWAEAVTATVHPSAILRAPDAAQREADYAAFVKDLIAVRERLNQKTTDAAGY
jgi:DNA polymerase